MIVVYICNMKKVNGAGLESHQATNGWVTCADNRSNNNDSRAKLQSHSVNRAPPATKSESHFYRIN